MRPLIASCRGWIPEAEGREAYAIAFALHNCCLSELLTYRVWKTSLFPEIALNFSSELAKYRIANLTYHHPYPEPPKRVVHILLECFLVVAGGEDAGRRVHHLCHLLVAEHHLSHPQHIRHGRTHRATSRVPEQQPRKHHRHDNNIVDIFQQLFKSLYLCCLIKVSGSLIPTAYEVRGEVMFLHLSVILSTGGGGVV